jgi:TP901 family phage tail tape measure protein
MAAVGDLVVNLLGKTGQFESAMMRSKQTLRSLHTSAVSVAQGIVGAFAGIRVVGLFTDAIRSGLDFNRAMRQSTAVMVGLSDTMKGRMRSSALDVARTMEFSAAQASKGFYYLASAGMSAEQQLAALPAVSRFAQAGQFDLARATELAMDALKSMGMEAKDPQENLAAITRTTDVLARVTTLANATTEQFAIALAKAGPSLRIFGKDIEEGVAVLAVFADQGMKAEEGGTAVTQVLRDVGRTAVKFAENYRQANIAVYDSAGNMRNVADIISDFEQRLGGLSDAAKTGALMELGIPFKSVRSLLALLGKSDAIRQFQSQLLQAGGYTKQVADAQITPAGLAFQRLKATAADVGGSLLTQFGPALMRIGAGLEFVLTTVSTSLPTILKYAGVYFAVSSALWTVDKAIRVVTWGIRLFTNAQQVAAKAAVVLQAITGPRGWIALAAGLGVAAVSIVAIDRLFAETDKKAQAVVQTTAKVPRELKAAAAAHPVIANLTGAFNDANTATGNLSATIESMADDAGDIDTLTESVERLTAAVGKAKGPNDLLAKQGSLTTGLLNQSTTQLRGFQGGGAPSPNFSGMQQQFAGLQNAPGLVGQTADMAVQAFGRLIAAQNQYTATQERVNNAVGAFSLENSSARVAALADAFLEFQGVVQEEAENLAVFQRILAETVAVFGDLGKASQWASDAMESIKTPQEKFEEAKKKIEAAAKLFPEIAANKDKILGKAQEDFNKALGDPQGFIQGMRDKLEELQTGLTDSERKMRDFAATPGVSPEQIAAMQDLIGKTKEAEKAADLKKKADQLTEEFASPAAKFAKAKEQLDKIREQNLITPEIYDKALADAREKSFGAAQEYTAPAAMERGSKEAWSNIVSSMNQGRKDKSEAIAEATTQTASNTAETNKKMDLLLTQRELMDF